jgi:hypothetical protein
MSTVNSFRSVTDQKPNHGEETEPSANIERLIAVYKEKIGTGWENIFAQTVKINIDYAG